MGKAIPRATLCFIRPCLFVDFQLPMLFETAHGRCTGAMFIAESQA
jgi:hypothetical protein